MTLRPLSSHRAFTLVELMVSIALALLLLVGVNQVFKTTTTTVGTGYATSQVMRTHMAIEKALNRDITRAVPALSAPSIIIHSEQIFAFADRNDLSSDGDQDPKTADFASTGANVAVKPADYNSRSHRIDTLSFFARDIDTPYRRQTANQPSSGTDGELIANEQSSEAWISIGHLRLPNNNPVNPNGYSTGDFFTPGQTKTSSSTPQEDLATNPNNYVASDWALGREAILLKTQPAGDYLRSGGGLNPLSYDSTATKEYAPGKAWQTPHARFDIANTSISTFHKLVTATQTANANWYQLLDYRFNGKPFVTRSNNRADMAEQMALTTPFLARGCTQFMVEFAGDFITQEVTTDLDNDGNVTLGKRVANTPDGVLDFVVDPSGTRRTRWYGMPRDVGSSPAGVYKGGPDGQIDVDYDVVPVRDVTGAVMSFEKDVPTQRSDYLAANAMSDIGVTYICAWGPAELAPATGYPSRPWMIRLVLQVTDPNGRLNQGQLVEYVYKLPAH